MSLRSDSLHLATRYVDLSGVPGFCDVLLRQLESQQDSSSASAAGLGGADMRGRDSACSGAGVGLRCSLSCTLQTAAVARSHAL